MRLIQCLKIIIFIVIYATVTPVNAEQAEGEKEVLPVNEVLANYASDLIIGNKLPTEKFNGADKFIVSNDADKYLLGILKGAALFQDNEFKLAAEKLEQAKLLEESLAQQQLDEAEFRLLNLLLANSYAAIGEFDKAFVAKKAYLLSLFNDTAAIDKARIEALEQKYEIEQKSKANLLLEEQSRLKKLKIVEAQQKRVDSERDYWALICIFVVFGLLMLRQLNIRRRLLWLAQIDSLTGLKNRSTLFDEGVSLFEQTKSGQQNLSVILVDVDHFKQVNDQYGHSIGDQVLQRIAKLGKEVMRSRDILARLGGEEFVALFPSANLTEAKAIAVRLKDKVAQEPFSTGDKSLQVTVSIGVVEYKNGMADLDELIKHADQAMYLAKANGRNQVVTAEE
jgi:diguanylate cyclase